MSDKHVAEMREGKWYLRRKEAALQYLYYALDRSEKERWSETLIPMLNGIREMKAIADLQAYLLEETHDDG